jgi:hypothetical protein
VAGEEADSTPGERGVDDVIVNVEKPSTRW